MYRWASIAAALSSTYNALEFCKHMGTILDNYRSNTARPLDSVVSYIQGLQVACKYTYVGLSFGIFVWYSLFPKVADDRLLFFVSMYQTGKMLMKSNDASNDLETPRPSGDESMVERKSGSQVNVTSVA
jgi:hypothetical protein